MTDTAGQLGGGRAMERAPSDILSNSSMQQMPRSESTSAPLSSTISRGLRVLGHVRGQADRAAAAPARVQPARRQLVHVRQQLALGHARVAHQQARLSPRVSRPPLNSCAARNFMVRDTWIKATNP